MGKLVDPCLVRPNELEPGDIMVVIVTCHVGYHTDADGNQTFRLYRCPFPQAKNVPQGMRVYSNLDALAQSLFPVVINAGMTGDVT